MTTTAARFLASITAEPGSWTAAEHGKPLGLDEKESRKLANRLTEAGKIAPRAYRICTFHVSKGDDATRIVGPFWDRPEPQQTALDIVRALEAGPLSAGKLAQRLGVAALTGSHKGVLKVLHYRGAVAPSIYLWPMAEEQAA